MGESPREDAHDAVEGTAEVSASPDGGSNPMSTSVFFIGGWHAKPEHIAAWERSARLKMPNVAFTGFPWPGNVTSWPPKDIVQGWKDKKQYQPVVDAIKACTANKIYIVGHSSGCAVSNAVDKEFKDPKRFVLVAL